MCTEMLGNHFMIVFLVYFVHNMYSNRFLVHGAHRWGRAKIMTMLFYMLISDAQSVNIIYVLSWLLAFLDMYLYIIIMAFNYFSGWVPLPKVCCRPKDAMGLV